MRDNPSSCIADVRARRADAAFAYDFDGLAANREMLADHILASQPMIELTQLALPYGLEVRVTPWLTFAVRRNLSSSRSTMSLMPRR